MRRFVNPGNAAFEVAVNSQIYVDKTGLLAYTNSVINTKQALICSSRPRRFGKSITADMLCAYYSRAVILILYLHHMKLQRVTLTENI